MDAKCAADQIISSIKDSNLNYHLQESPFSLLINLRKSFIRNKNGDPIMPSSDITVKVADSKDKMKVAELEKENTLLHGSLNHLETELNHANEALHGISLQYEKSRKELGELLVEKTSSSNEIENEEI